MAERLAAFGWTILARNVRVARSELDIVAIDPGPPAMLVVVEVRANRASTFGTPEESVAGRKLRSVYGAALRLRVLGVLPDGLRLPRFPLRVDLVAVEMSPALGPSVGGTVLRYLRGVIG